jgi:uncharacterized protein (DUF302 family)
LKSEGFGVLTLIDVRATMKEKLGVDFRPYVILGACNPPLAHNALSLDSSVGVMLPCNVTVESISENASLVRIANPEVMLTVGPFEGVPGMAEVALLARTRLERVAQSLTTA